MKQLFLFILLMLEVSNEALYAQPCSGSPLFKQGKQLVFLVETSPESIAHGSPATAKSIVPAVMNRMKNTYLIDSVKSQGITIDAVFRISKSENLTTDVMQKNPASASTFNKVSCNGRSIYYTTTVRSARTNATYVTEYPLDMKVGDKLKDNIIESSKGGDKKSGGYNVLVERSVVGQEIISTPAGKWNCFKIAETFTTTIPGSNGGPPTSITGATPDYTWFTPDLGIIKITMGTWYTTTLIALP